jgi:hypothetical protein
MAHGNRIGLAVVGVIGLAAGAAGLARGLGQWPDLLGDDGAPVLEENVRELASRSWFWPVVAAVLAAVALLALRWLAVQGERGTVRTLRIEPDTRRGGTTLPARAVSGAFVDDLAGDSGLRRIQARLVVRPSPPRLAVTAALPPTTDPAAAKQHLYEALGRHRQALETDDLPASLRLH